MKTLTFLTGALATLTTAQTPSPYTDPKSGITFNLFQHTSGMFFGLALPANSITNTSFIATIGGKGTGYSGVSLGGGMLNKLLLIAWPNGQNIVASFRKTAYVLPSYHASTAPYQFRIVPTPHPPLRPALSPSARLRMGHMLTSRIGLILFCVRGVFRRMGRRLGRGIGCRGLGL